MKTFLKFLKRDKQRKYKNIKCETSISKAKLIKVVNKEFNRNIPLKADLKIVKFGREYLWFTWKTRL